MKSNKKKHRLGRIRISSRLWIDRSTSIDENVCKTVLKADLKKHNWEKKGNVEEDM